MAATVSGRNVAQLPTKGCNGYALGSVATGCSNMSFYGMDIRPWQADS